MAASLAISSSSLFAPEDLKAIHRSQNPFLFHNYNRGSKYTQKYSTSFRVRAAKLPPGVEIPKVEPTFRAPFLGFTKTAERWNSRACMIGLIGTFIVELILNKGILQIIGVDVGKGLDIPL